MARTSGIETRDKLIRAAEEIFAAQGVDGARTRDIVRLAGQSNPSAVQYHFGDRGGLLDAVMAGRLERTEAALTPLLEELPDPDLEDLVRALVTAEATQLSDLRGLRCLRISAQLSHESGIRTRTPHPTLAGTAYWRLIERIESSLAAAELPEPIRLERTDLALTLIGAALADRARQYLDGARPLTTEPVFLADLVTTTVALLRAPAPKQGRTAE
ncbi:TetR/AcrR family transcriptional regulator [Streptomyces olivaceiscleroticus]|uniref:HTH tetR-type domain-containing protein n=1 Tax=Streptomyces olivaceiscleroticus TaxID=68245 RepID=A0ABP3K6P6_9ACTN